jgi:hypothetical protein
MAVIGTVAILLVVTFKYGVGKGEAYSFAGAWNRGLVQGFLVVNAALILTAIALLKLQPWARWAACLWGAALGANALITEAWHYQAVSGASVFESVVIASLWGWFCYRELVGREAEALFPGNFSR